MVNSGNPGQSEESSDKRSGGLSNNDNSTSAKRRRFLKAAGAGSAVAVAGCLGGRGTTTGTEGGGTPTGPLTVGVLAPHTGTENPIGNSIAQSAKLAANELNENGGVHGGDVEVVVKETEEDPQTGLSKYEELAVGEDADVTTGVFTSEVLLNLMDSISQQGTVHLSSGAATPETAQMVKDDYESYKYWFRTGPINSHFLGQNMADFAGAKLGDLGWESVYVLVEDFKWTQPVDSVLQEELSDAGIEVAGRQRYASDTENFTPIYDQVESSGADAVYAAMAHTGTPAIIQWAKQQRPFEFGGIHVPMQLPSYYGLVSGACRYAVVQNTATPTSEITDKTVPYAEAYREMVGKYPVYTGYITYDAVKMYAEAARAAGSRNADDIVSELEGMTYTGTAGSINYYGQSEAYPHDVKYDPDGEDGVRPVWFQWQQQDGSGTQTALHPENLSEGTYQKPPWV
jgi:branched-chain amino acid transport system substrate-binding protein